MIGYNLKQIYRGLVKSKTPSMLPKIYPFLYWVHMETVFKIFKKKKKKPVFKCQKQNILKSYIASTYNFQLFCYIKILWCFAFTGHCNAFQILFTYWIIRKYIGNLFSTKHFSWNDFNTHKKFDNVWMYNAFWIFRTISILFLNVLKVHLNSSLVFQLNYYAGQL